MEEAYELAQVKRRNDKMSSPIKKYVLRGEAVFNQHENGAFVRWDDVKDWHSSENCPKSSLSWEQCKKLMIAENFMPLPARLAKTGYKNVYKNKHGSTYMAQLIVNGEKKYLGNFDTPENANEAVLKFKEFGACRPLAPKCRHGSNHHRHIHHIQQDVLK